METLRLEHVYKVFKGKRKDGDVIAVKDFNLSIEDNEFLVFVGPSGCGKSTTLRMIAGLEDLSYGNIYIDGQLVNKIEPNYRNIAMVFQNYALYPHMSAYDNMAFGLKNRKVPKDEIDKRIHEVAKILDIEDLLKRKPKAMSGGQRQRVALGRAIVRTPKIFLLDEPLSNLDAKLRAQMRVEINKLYEKLKITFIYVTHDQVEAMTMGSRIVVMRKGVVQQIDTPTNLYDYPRNRFVAGFLGTPQMNFFEGTIKKSGENTIIFKFSNNEITFDLNELRLIDNEYLDGYEHKAIIGIRPEDVEITPSGSLIGKVNIVETLGNSSLVYADFNLSEQNSMKESPTSIVINEQGRTVHKTNEEIRIRFKPNKVHFFKDEEDNEISIMLSPRSKRDEIVGYLSLEDDQIKIKTEEGVVLKIKEQMPLINNVYKNGIHRVKVVFNDSIKITNNKTDIKLKYLGVGLLDGEKQYAFSFVLTDYSDAFYENNLHIYLKEDDIEGIEKLNIGEHYFASIDPSKFEIIGDDKLSIFDLNEKIEQLDHYKFVEVADKNINLIVKPTKEKIGEEIAQRILDKIEEKSDTVLGLATGSSPLPLYNELIKQSKVREISFKNVRTFNLDEYLGLDEDNNQSYRYFMNENLFKYLDFGENSHSFPSEFNYESYDEEIKDANGIDIQILGIGRNGHIAFNEPKTPLNSLTHITNLTKKTIKDNSRFFENVNEVPTKAITMGLQSILNAKEIYLIATGKNKAKAVSKILEGKYNPKYPASCLNLATCKVHLYVDEECYIALDKKALSKYELSLIK